MPRPTPSFIPSSGELVSRDRKVVCIFIEAARPRPTKIVIKERNRTFLNFPAKALQLRHGHHLLQWKTKSREYNFVPIFTTGHRPIDTDLVVIGVSRTYLSSIFVDKISCAPSEHLEITVRSNPRQSWMQMMAPIRTNNSFISGTQTSSTKGPPYDSPNKGIPVISPKLRAKYPAECEL